MDILEKYIANYLPDWAIVILIILLMTYILYKIRSISSFLKKALFKDDGPDYKELTGAMGFIGISLMIIIHLIDRTYKPDIQLLGVCVIIVFGNSGIKEGSKLIDLYINRKFRDKNNGKEDKT